MDHIAALRTAVDLVRVVAAVVVSVADPAGLDAPVPGTASNRVAWAAAGSVAAVRLVFPSAAVHIAIADLQLAMGQKGQIKILMSTQRLRLPS